MYCKACVGIFQSRWFDPQLRCFWPWTMFSWFMFGTRPDLRIWSGMQLRNCLPASLYQCTDQDFSSAPFLALVQVSGWLHSRFRATICQGSLYTLVIVRYFKGENSIWDRHVLHYVAQERQTGSNMAIIPWTTFCVQSDLCQQNSVCLCVRNTTSFPHSCNTNLCLNLQWQSISIKPLNTSRKLCNISNQDPSTSQRLSHMSICLRLKDIMCLAERWKGEWIAAPTAEPVLGHSQVSTLYAERTDAGWQAHHTHTREHCVEPSKWFPVQQCASVGETNHIVTCDDSTAAGSFHLQATIARNGMSRKTSGCRNVSSDENLW